MLGAVCHDFGKPATTARIDGRIRSLNHEEMGVPPAAAFLDRINIHTLEGYDVRRQVLGLVAHHLKPGMWHTARNGVRDGAFRRLARKVDPELLARVAKSDCLGRTGNFDCSAMDWFLERARSLGVERAAPAPLLLGRHLLQLGLAPGPRIDRSSIRCTNASSKAMSRRSSRPSKRPARSSPPSGTSRRSSPPAPPGRRCRRL